MRGIINLIVGILCIVQLVYFFINKPEVSSIFGFEVPNIAFLLFWGFMAVSSLFSFVRATKKPRT